MKNFAIGSCLILLAAAFDCHADGLGTLIEVGKSQAEIQKEYAEETKAFERIKNGIESGAITKGQTKKSIKEKYGQPVVAIEDPDGKRKDWIYKPASSSFFKGIRAILIFTEEGLLDDFQLEER